MAADLFRCAIMAVAAGRFNIERDELIAFDLLRLVARLGQRLVEKVHASKAGRRA